MGNRRDTGQLGSGHLWLRTFGSRTGMMQERKDAGRLECRNREMLERRHAGQEGFRTGGSQNRRDAGK